MIPRDAKICPHCRKSQDIAILLGGAVVFFILLLIVGLISTITENTSSIPPTINQSKKYTPTEKIIQLGKLHPDWPLKTREAIAQGRVEKGMSPSQVIAAWGQPQRSFKMDPKGNHQYWHYNEIVLYIKNHKVFEFRKKRRPH